MDFIRRLDPIAVFIEILFPFEQEALGFLPTELAVIKRHKTDLGSYDIDNLMGILERMIDENQQTRKVRG